MSYQLACFTLIGLKHQRTIYTLGQLMLIEGTLYNFKSSSLQRGTFTLLRSKISFLILSL